ncbi:hypothetical protein AGR3A_Lc30008 [Agrobacterium tomkonis CFBP 6623]|uniref:Uncharacterized protein n=1 Tax=Agrobacterium tomkonis CFBP 6623 TaxID=1183432 RepID=A0A1S7S4F5_9HYPH|nr:hypothetical protein AGR3A_Lc30008 [Agrobacterium tomkonis CFBP 6623]
MGSARRRTQAGISAMNTVTRAMSAVRKLPATPRNTIHMKRYRVASSVQETGVPHIRVDTCKSTTARTPIAARPASTSVANLMTLPKNDDVSSINLSSQPDRLRAGPEDLMALLLADGGNGLVKESLILHQPGKDRIEAL